MLHDRSFEFELLEVRCNSNPTGIPTNNYDGFNTMSVIHLKNLMD